MGAQSGIFYFDLRPIGAADGLIAGLEPLSPDGVTVHTEDGVAMAYGAFDVWRGECGASQPHRSAAGAVMTWDGRLDNRRDLECRLSSTPASDVELALDTFARRGIDGMRDLVGDWAAAIWDPSTRTVHLARDYMGPRPLYYLQTAEFLAWSTCLGELAVRTRRAEAISEAFVAAFIARRTTVDVTPYDGIRAVPAATCLSFSTNGIEQRRRFWDLAPAVVRYRDHRQYEDHLRSVWADAIGARLSTARTVWAELSGGLDSSSVVCMADALLRSGRAPAAGIRPVSHATLQSPEGDERRFIAEVEARIGVQSVIVGVEQHQACRDSEREWISPYALGGVGLACVEQIRAAGGRVVLSGRAGDAVMGAQVDNSVAVFDDLADSSVLEALAGVRSWSRACRIPFVEAAWHLLREVGEASRLAAARSARHERVDGGLNLLTPSLRASLPDRPVTTPFPKEIRLAKRRLAHLVMDYADGARLQMPSHPPDFLITYPFTHRPLVELVLAIPGHELSAPGAPRNLMRRAFADFVPARILRRVSKGYYPPAMLRAIRPTIAAMLPVDTFEVVRRGWVDAARLDQAIRGLVDGTNATALEVRPILRLEEWIRSRQRRAPVAIPQRKEVRHHEVRNA
jgi:asparagine synthase (glutamine-hydrolysing)